MRKQRDCLGACNRGAYILFGRNLESATQLRKFIDDLRDLSDIEPIITIDQEGGRVSRLRRIGNEPPNAQQLREKNNIDLIRRHGDITGRLLRLFGFNLDLCPVLDISFNDDAENSLHGRCYGKMSNRLCAMPVRLMKPCAGRGSPVAANIFPVTRPQLQMLIFSCPGSIAPGKNLI